MAYSLHCFLQGLVKQQSSKDKWNKKLENMRWMKPLLKLAALVVGVYLPVVVNKGEFSIILSCQPRVTVTYYFVYNC